jgi:hypothetical protein
LMLEMLEGSMEESGDDTQLIGATHGLIRGKMAIATAVKLRRPAPGA